MTIKTASVWPVNELNEIVMEKGTGTSTVTGFVSSDQVAINPTTNKVPVKLPDSGTDEVLTGFVSAAGVVANTDTVEQAIEKLDGNIALKANGAGTATNDSASAGKIGEFKTSTVAVGSAVPLTDSTAANVTTLALTAGDWDVTGVVDFAMTGATATQFTGAASLTTAAIPSQVGGAGLGTDAIAITPLATITATGNYAMPLPTVRVSLAVPATLYLVAHVAFSVGAVDAFGTVRARRVR